MTKESFARVHRYTAAAAAAAGAPADPPGAAAGAGALARGAKVKIHASPRPAPPSAAARRAADDSAPPRAARRGRVMNPPKTKPSVDWHASISGAALSVCRQSDASDDPSVAEAYARFQVSSCDVSGRCDHREHRCATAMKVRRPCISTSGPPSPPASAGAISAQIVGAGRRSVSAAAAGGIIAGRPPKRH